MMDFFERQEQAKKKTGQLIFLFILSIIAIILAIYFGISLALGFGDILIPHFDLSLFTTVSIAVLFIVISGSLWRIITLSRSGGRGIAEMLGGRPANLNTTDLYEKKLINVVEEMALASGIPVPEIYILDQEKGINAFAAGHTSQNAVVGVTEGSIRTLTRDELQGVIAHEFSHILNGDMRLNIRLMGFLHGILLLGIIGYYLLRSTSSRTYRSDKKGGNPLPFLGLILLVVGYVGVFFGKLIKASISRQREFLADASAVQFTRNPFGLAGALKKIGGSTSRLATSKAEEASHLFFSLGTNQWLEWMSTHPPLQQRIKALDPTWTGNFNESASIIENVLENEPSFIAAPSPLSIPQLISQVGSPTSQHVDYANDFRQKLAPEIEIALRESSGACALIFALLLSEEPQLREKQMQLIIDFSEPVISQNLRQLISKTLSLDISAKLPLVQLALPALKLLSPKQYQDFNTLLDQLIDSDAKLDVFEFVLQKMIRKYLTPTKNQKSNYFQSDWPKNVSLLLSLLARVGTTDEAVAQQSYIRGVKMLTTRFGFTDLLPPLACQLQHLDPVLDQLAKVTPQIKKKIISACAETISFDGVINIEEGELLRAIADTLDCAIPPLILMPSIEIKKL